MADKLFGTADTGLINVAYRAAMANVPADLSGVYDKVVKSHGDFMKKVSESADKLFADVEKYDQEMKNTFQPIYESMENGTYTDADILSFQDQLSSFRDEWKSIPKGKAGDDARLLWKSKVGKFKNDVVSMNQTLTNLSYIVANEEHIALDNPEDAQFLSAIGRLHSGEEGLKATKTIKDGRIVYQVNIGGKVIEKNQEDIKKLVSPKDYTAISNLESQLDLANKMPSGGYTKYDGDGAAYIARNIYNIIKSSGDGKSKLDAYRTLANYRYAGGKTFREAIYQDDLLSSVLSTSLLNANLPSKFDVSGPDGKPDGKVDKTDLLNEQNYNALADYILKTPDVGGQLLANWYAASEGSKIFDRANKAYKVKTAKENQEKGRGETFSYGFRSSKVINKTIDRLRDLITKESGEIKMPNGRVVEWDKSENSFVVDGELQNPQTILDDAFDSLYTVEDIFGDYDFTSKREAEKKETGGSINIDPDFVQPGERKI
tara:strand:+ start:1549 stop:3015 length:1467 start_codon:yes stop_codon:yes gene_type:complete